MWRACEATRAVVPSALRFRGCCQSRPGRDRVRGEEQMLSSCENLCRGKGPHRDIVAHTSSQRAYLPNLLQLAEEACSCFGPSAPNNITHRAASPRVAQLTFDSSASTAWRLLDSLTEASAKACYRRYQLVSQLTTHNALSFLAVPVRTALW